MQITNTFEDISEKKRWKFSLSLVQAGLGGTESVPGVGPVRLGPRATLGNGVMSCQPPEKRPLRWVRGTQSSRRDWSQITASLCQYREVIR